MKKIIPVLISLFFLQISCNKQKTTASATSTSSEAPIEVPEKFSVDSVKVEDSLKITDNLTVSFASNVLIFPQIKDKPLLDSIYSRENIFASDYSKATVLEKLNENKTKYFNENKEASKEYLPNFKQTWNTDSNMEMFSNKDEIMTLRYTGDGFSGGAHGYYYEFYEVFDLKNKKKIQLSDLFEDPKSTIWNKILMDNFLKNDLDNGQAQMLLVKDIPLNNNFYFDDQNVCFLYNQYEITAYAAGPVLIKIPFSTMKPLMKPEIKSRLGL